MVLLKIRRMITDNLLLILIKKGDVTAFKQFFEGFYPSACLFAEKYLKDADLAEDIAQEAFIEFWKINEKFTDIKTIKGYIYKVIRNKCLNQLKSSEKRKNILKDKLSSDDYFYELIIEEETYRMVHSAVDKLAPQSRKIVLLSLEGLKNQDIADQLGVSLNTLKTLKKNSYKELRNHLKDCVFIFILLSHLIFS